MKLVNNKLMIYAFALMICIINASHLRKKVHKKSHHKKKQVHLVQDKLGFGSDLGLVVRKTPSVITQNRLGQALLPLPQRSNWFSNSNTSNLPNVGDLGKRAEIINPQLVFHNRQPVSVVKETPAHMGWRTETENITSLNKDTGKVENHTYKRRYPFMDK